MQHLAAGPILWPPKQTKLGSYRARPLPVSKGVQEATRIMLLPCLKVARQRVLANVALTPVPCLGTRAVHLFRQIPAPPEWLHPLQKLRPRKNYFGDRQQRLLITGTFNPLVNP